ncbi:uncharacterized protein [Amphiura filiformis]|uniref:uncharacterized protein n=1 Tax=Amphiura filiformis TaxID=82378 RepID=UPI003B211281
MGIRQNGCPAVTVPLTPNSLSCYPASTCLGVTCCVDLDLVITKLQTKAWIILDPCQFTLSIGLGMWELNITLVEYAFGQEKTEMIGDVIEFRYNIAKLDVTKEFDLDLSLNICIDGTCITVPILFDVKVPIPLCSTNGSVSLPGDGSINGYVKEIAGQAGQDAVMAVLQNFGLEDFLSLDPCSLPSITGDNCANIDTSTLPNIASCQLDPRCLGVQCCLNLDVQIVTIATRAWFLLDPCDYQLSIGLGSWYLNISLFSYSFGVEEMKSIGEALNVSFTIAKLDILKSYQVDLTVHVILDDHVTDITVLQKTQIPIPLCNQNTTVTLPGDGTVQGFVLELGNSAGQTAIDLVFAHLDLNNYVSGKECAIKEDYSTCPTINVPYYKDQISCAVLDKTCLGIQCCINMDYKIAKLMHKAWIVLDPCNYQFSIGFENWSHNQTLYTYTWGTQEYFNLGSFLTVSYSINKVPTDKVFRVSLGIRLCIDGVCTNSPILESIQLHLPVCSFDADDYQLPGDGSVAGFVQQLGGKIGQSAVEVVMLKLDLNSYLNDEQCKRNGPGSTVNECPSVSLSTPNYASCEVMSSCNGIQCCLEVDFKVTNWFVSAWVILDPCHFWFSFGTEKWSTNVTLVGYTMGEVRDIDVHQVVQASWSVDILPSESTAQIDFALKICIDDSCDVRNIMDNARIPIPECSTSSEYFKFTDPCNSNPCQNSGTCVRNGDNYECACIPEYIGTHCETRGKDQVVLFITYEGRSKSWTSIISSLLSYVPGY